MPSPFPGMDPYLEAHWRDVHAGLIVYMSGRLQKQLPRELRARVVFEAVEGIDEGDTYPDIRVVEYSSQVGSPQRVAQVAVAEPLLLATEPLTETYVAIIDTASGNRVVTEIEILSPTNKTPGIGRRSYQRKQLRVCESDTSLVEIDLLREGQHTLAFPIKKVPKDKRTTYFACVNRAWEKGEAEVYPIALASPLPAFRVPLRQSDTDVVLALQPLIELAYEEGGYDGTIDYTKDPTPPFTQPEATWADALLRAKGIRTDAPPKPKSKQPRKK